MIFWKQFSYLASIIFVTYELLLLKMTTIQKSAQSKPTTKLKQLIPMTDYDHGNSQYTIMIKHGT